MSEQQFGIKSTADRRYYHFVVVSGRGITSNTYWKALHRVGTISRAKVAAEPQADRFLIEHRKLMSDRVYARGQTAESLSERGNGRPPFFYDLFAAKVHFKKEEYWLLAFPFAALASEVINSLVSDRSFAEIAFHGVELSSLLNDKNRPFKRYDGLSSRVMGVQFVVTDDKSLTAVRLGGDDPFHAQIYEAFLKPKFEQNLWVPDQCVLACEREINIENGNSRPVSAVLRTRLHIDKFGNFKFYMHTGCANVLLMPYAVAQIRALGSLNTVFGNPLRRMLQASEPE